MSKRQVTNFLPLVAVLILAVFQVFDGLYTYEGIHRLGTIEAEGNPLLKASMYWLGVEATLLLSKGFGFFSCLAILLVYRGTHKLINLAIYGVTIFYSVAVGGWIWMLA